MRIQCIVKLKNGRCAEVGRVGKDSRRGSKVDMIDGFAEKDTSNGEEGEIVSGDTNEVEKCGGEVSDGRVTDEEE